MPEKRFDVVVVGAGAAGLTAAAVAAAEGARVLLLEHSPLVGGTTAISGGMVWVPANHLAAEAPQADSLDAARTYLRHTVPEGDERDRALLEAFLTCGDEAIRYLLARTALRLRPVPRYPDYYPDRPGATAGGRVLEPMPFDARTLLPPEAFALMRPPLPEFMLFGGMMVHRSDIPHLRRAWRSPRAALHAGRLVARYAAERLAAPRGTTLHLGNALVGWLLKSALDLGVEVRVNTAVRRLVIEGKRVIGIEIRQRGSAPACVQGGQCAQDVQGPQDVQDAQVPQRVLAARAVILASGGLSHDAELRQRYLPAAAGDLSATVDPGGATSGARLALAAGAQLSLGTGTRQAFWVPGSVFTRRDGTTAVYPHTVTDRGKPGLIAVDHRGQRFVNEAVSYHEFVRAQLRGAPDAVPAWLVCDRRFLRRYGLGAVKPFAGARSVEVLVANGSLKRAQSLASLAAQMGVPAAAFEATVAAFNADARRGIDTALGRGSDIYQRHLGDAEHQPNPCVAPIDTAPFFAVAVRPADLGMAAGIVTDASARVLDAAGTPIEGLYACGNDMQSVMNGAYPGPGVTLGPALVFGFLAGRAAAAG